MNIKAEVTIAKPIAEAWEVMGNQFDRPDRWSSNFHTSEGGGSSRFAGTEYGYRKTTTDRGEIIQELEAFDPEQYSFAYRITKGAPPVAESASAVWSLHAQGANETLATLDFTMIPKAGLPPEILAKIEMGIKASTQQLAEELKYYVENGQPHPNKLAAIN